jgi:sugar phosphate isomerase/epimerase
MRRHPLLLHILKGSVMDLGIFELVFPRPTLTGTLDVVVAHGVRHIQFDFVSAGLSAIPRDVSPSVASHIRQECDVRGITIAAVSGTYNMIHPDPHIRDEGLAGMRAIAAACHAIGTRVITLCTGTRNVDSMWRPHPDNNSADAWQDLIASLADALAIADEHDVTLAFEPEPANVVNSAARGQDLLLEMGHPRLKVVMDVANIVATDRSRPPEVVLDEAFDLLGDHVVVTHAKDLSADGAFCAAGQGIVPWDHCLTLFHSIGFNGPMILHSLHEDEADEVIRFMRDSVDRAGTRRHGP